MECFSLWRVWGKGRGNVEVKEGEGTNMEGKRGEEERREGLGRGNNE